MVSATLIQPIKKDLTLVNLIRVKKNFTQAEDAHLSKCSSVVLKMPDSFHFDPTWF